MITKTFEHELAILEIDDGKANALGHDLIDALEEALEESLDAAKVVVLSGREGIFSAGFDLKEFEKGPQATMDLVQRGAHLLLKMFTHPQPVVAACTGHAVAAGALLLLASDTRVGAGGDFKIGLNETAIGMSLPVFGLELARARLSSQALTRAVVQAELYSPEAAASIGFLDLVVAPDELQQAALEEASKLKEIAGSAYAGNKLGIREPAAAAIRESLL